MAVIVGAATPAGAAFPGRDIAGNSAPLNLIVLVGDAGEPGGAAIDAAARGAAADKAGAASGDAAAAGAAPGTAASSGAALKDGASATGDTTEIEGAATEAPADPETE